MTKYNSYQEAKISNPESEIYVSMNGNFAAQDYVSTIALSGIKEGWNKCKPADHCMTVEKFLADGHKLEIDDVIFGEDEGDVDVVSSDLHCRSFNMPVDADRNIYILRAAALENIPTETPEEKEVLDSIESAGEVEWKNGDECVYMSHKVIHQFIGADPKREGYGYIQATGYEVNFVELSKLSKPETPHHREERERLEAGYELYKTCGIQHETVSFNEWVDDYKDVWLNIVDKTNYRKEKSHGAN